MAGETTICVTGNTAGEVELRYTNSGTAIASVTVVSTPRSFDKASNSWKDGEPMFLRCKAFKQLAEHCAECLPKGTRVVVQGRLQQRSWTTDDGQKRSMIELVIDEIGPSLKWATAKVNRVERT